MVTSSQSAHCLCTTDRYRCGEQLTHVVAGVALSGLEPERRRDERLLTITYLPVPRALSPGPGWSRTSACGALALIVAAP